MSDPKWTPDERAELIAFAERLSLAWQGLADSTRNQDWKTARYCVLQLTEAHALPPLIGDVLDEASQALKRLEDLFHATRVRHLS